MTKDLFTTYEEQVDTYSKRLTKIQTRSKLISLFRLLVFITAIITVYYLSRTATVSTVLITIFLAAFLFVSLIKYHAVILAKKKLYEAYIKINKAELSALEGKIQQFDPGNRFINPDHPYTSDLDIFGDGGLFQFLNRTSTIIGMNRLAFRLANVLAGKNEIIRIQEAVAELKDAFYWRQKFQASGNTFSEKEEDKNRILNWIQQLPVFDNIIFGIFVYLVPPLTTFMIYLLSTQVITEQLFIMYLLIPLGISGFYSIKINKRHLQVSKTSEMLNKYSILLNIIDELDGNSEKIVKLKSMLKQNEVRAGMNIKKLSKILNALDNRLNFVSWVLLNGTLLWDIMHMRRLEKWQKQNKELLPVWFEVIAEIDSLISMATYHYNNPDVTFPVIVNDKYELSAESLGHPLIDRKYRVNNPVEIRESEFTIITGANMAGKSTFLRTIGVNMILGMVGAPVCGKKFRLRPVQIFTSITTKDSLQKNESYFYSELKRLKYIIDELKRGTKLFVILDEILKGTNSKDKHSGSEALIKQFISLEACGIVATHDVILGKLEAQFPTHIKNRCFEVDIEGNQLIFDYKIRAGISKNLNATHLMREMGITV